LKVLLVHDHYRSSAPSGEDQAYRNEKRLLETHGVQVIAFERFNDAIEDATLMERVKLARDSAWSWSAYQDIVDVIREARPDVAHFHNTFPLVSPSGYKACQDSGVPVVQTLHNYRLICPGALLMRGGRPCEDCVGASLLPALRHRCYRGTLPATGAVVWMLASNRWRGTYHRAVNRYIALTRFAAQRLVAGGLPEQRIEVKPNFLPDVPKPGDGQGSYAIYVGRLSEEKGVSTLLEAWKSVRGLNLKLVGDGPLAAQLRSSSKWAGSAIEFCGYRPRSEVLNLIRDAVVQIVPSQCYEGFPLAVLEAYASGTPVIASRLGSLDEIVLDGETGIKFEAGNAGQLAASVMRLQADSAARKTMRARTRALFEERYTATRNFDELMAIYRRAVEDFEADRGLRT
jgi:glycosyltransferase involved in cell wall biosynthesis